MSTARIALAFALSIAPTALAWTGDARLEGLSLLGLALVPWIALAGMPGLERSSLAVAICAPWPALALGAALDVRAGAAWGTLAPTLVWAVLIVAVLASLAARGGAPGELARYDLAWLALVVAPPLLCFALDYGAGAAAAPRALTELASCSPLGWAVERARGAAPGPTYLPWQPCIGLALLALARRLDLRRRGAP